MRIENIEGPALAAVRSDGFQKIVFEDRLGPQTHPVTGKRIWVGL